MTTCPYCDHDLTHNIANDLDYCQNCQCEFPVDRPMRVIVPNHAKSRDNWTEVATLCIPLVEDRPALAELLTDIYRWSREIAERHDNELRGGK